MDNFQHNRYHKPNWLWDKSLAQNLRRKCSVTDPMTISLLNQNKDKNVYRIWRRKIGKEILWSELLPCRDCHHLCSFTSCLEREGFNRTLVKLDVVSYCRRGPMELLALDPCVAKLKWRDERRRGLPCLRWPALRELISHRILECLLVTRCRPLGGGGKRVLAWDWPEGP